jgi:hypothetical protein
MIILYLAEGAMCNLPLLSVFSCSFENVNDKDLRCTYFPPQVPESTYTCIITKAGVDVVTMRMLYLAAGLQEGSTRPNRAQGLTAGG